MKKMENERSKVAFQILNGLIVIVLSALAVLLLRTTGIDQNAQVLVGVIITGFISILKDNVQALRGFSMSEQLGKVTDQLASSRPATGEPQEVAVVNPPSDPVNVTGDVK